MALVANLGGVVTINGNLFKDNTLNGVQNNGSAGTLDATYNSWGDNAGPAGTDGDDVGLNVAYKPWNFAEIYFDVDPTIFRGPVRPRGQRDQHLQCGPDGRRREPVRTFLQVHV